MEPITTAALISGGGRLLSGLLGRSAQSSANRANLKIAREQMAFQERMRDTAVQARRKDLEAAGLNPVLAASEAAASPAGQTATMMPVDALAKSVGDMMTTAMQVKKLAQETNNLKQDGRVKKNLADVSDSVTPSVLKGTDKGGEWFRDGVDAIDSSIDAIGELLQEGNYYAGKGMHITKQKMKETFSSREPRKLQYKSKGGEKPPRTIPKFNSADVQSSWEKYRRENPNGKYQTKWQYYNKWYKPFWRSQGER